MGKEREIETRGDLVNADAVAPADISGCSSSSTPLAASSFFWSHKLDGLYLVFFMVHIPIILRTYIPARFFSSCLILKAPLFLFVCWPDYSHGSSPFLIRPLSLLPYSLSRSLSLFPVGPRKNGDETRPELNISFHDSFAPSFVNFHITYLTIYHIQFPHSQPFS